MPQPDDFLVKRKKEGEEKSPSEEAEFTWFGPVGVKERFRFLVLREAGDQMSVLPNADARFKTGLKALRWSEREGGEATVWLVQKTKPNRIDLRKVEARPGDLP